MYTVDEKRFSAILALQKKQKEHLQGSYLFEIYDKAIDLALNPKREVNDFFKRNLFRDAKRILSRQKKRESPFVDLSLVDSEPIYLNRVSFLENLFSEEMYEIIHNECKWINPHAPEILEDLISGIPIRETVINLEISESLVKKIRIQIKNLTQKLS